MATNVFFAQDNASRQDLALAKQAPVVKRSVFPYGRSNLLKFNEGYIIPVDLIPIIPGDSCDIDLVAAITSLNPFVTRMFSGMQVFIHAFFQKNEHEWRGWKNFSTQGRRGNITLSMPKFSPLATTYLALNGYCLENTFITSPNSFVQASFGIDSSLSAYLFNYAGYKLTNVTSYSGNSFKLNNQVLSSGEMDSYGIGFSSQRTRSYHAIQLDGTISGGSFTPATVQFQGQTVNPLFNAIPPATYQRNYRDFYAPKNLIKDNPMWFPDDEEDFQLPYSSSSNILCLSNSRPDYNVYSLVPNNNRTVLAVNATPTNTVQYADGPILGALRCRQFEGDIFTTGLPFLERGGVTQQWHEIIAALNSQGLPFADNTLTKENLSQKTNGYLQPLASRNISSGEYSSIDRVRADYTGPNTGADGSNMQYSSVLSGSLGYFQTINALRELAVMTAWSEKNARTDGDYNSLIRAHFGVDPNSQDFSSQYLGGSRFRINFDNIVQQSESANTPLGTRAAIAQGAGSGSLGHYEFYDFGFIHIYLSMIPDTFYNQGIEPWNDAAQTGVDLPFPEFTSLPRAAVPKKRVFYAGSATDDDLFEYQERFLDYKFRQNHLSGPMLDVTDRDTRAMTFARYFTSHPEFNSEFVTASPYQLRDDMYTVPKEFHWVCQFADSIRMVRSLPWVNQEANLANIA